MGIINQNWYDLQANRRYPLDETSTGVGDDGLFIRDDILVDCHIKFPVTCGTYLYVQGVTVSTNLVTVVFGASTALNLPGTPVAAVSVVKPAAASVNYAITALQPGVTGWVVFGPGIDTNFVGRYTAASQSLVSPRCGRPYTPLPVPTLGKLNLKTALEGIVSSVGQQPVKVSYVKDAVAVGVGAIVVELDTTLTTSTYNPLKEFLGPCSQRPESGTCPHPAIESINGITPDADGNINIVFENFAAATNFTACGGLNVQSDSNLPDLCKKAKLDTTDPDDKCKDTKSADIDLTWPDPTKMIPDLVIVEPPIEGPYTPAAVPACVDFAACGGQAVFTRRVGTFSVVTATAPGVCPTCVSSGLTADAINTGGMPLTSHNVYRAANTSTLNVATYNNFTTDLALGNTVTVELQLQTTALARNGGVLLNYLNYVGPSGALQTTFVAVLLDANQQELRVLRYTNSSVTVEGSAQMVVQGGAWYRLSVTPIRDGANIAVNIYAEEITNPGGPTTELTVQIAASSYGSLVGPAGIFTSQADTYFSKLTVIA